MADIIPFPGAEERRARADAKAAMANEKDGFDSWFETEQPYDPLLEALLELMEADIDGPTVA